MPKPVDLGWSWLIPQKRVPGSRWIFFLPDIATESICVDLLETLEEILSDGIGELYARHGRGYNVFVHAPFLVESQNGVV